MRSATRSASSRLLAMPFAGCLRLSRCTSAANRSRSSARSILSGEVPRIGTPSSCNSSASLSGVWPPELDDHAQQLAPFLLAADDLEHVLDRQRLEIEPVRGVRVGRDRLRIAIDHNHFEAGARLAVPVATEREGRVAAAIVELDPLPDPVRPAAEDHHLATLGDLPPRPPARRTRAIRMSSTDRASRPRTPPRNCRCA